MEDIITRYCISPEIELLEHDPFTGELVTTYNYNEFCSLIDRWKIILVEKYDAKPGQTIFLYDGPALIYYALIFAAAELGLVFVVDWPHCHTENDLNNPKVTMWAPIDFLFIHSEHHILGTKKGVSQWEKQRNLTMTKNILFTDKFFTCYDITQSKRITEIINTIWATPDSNIIYSSSSGTTGMPKRIVNTHKKIYRQATRCMNLFFAKNDSSMHYKTINHGASLCYHFLPSFMAGGKQYTPQGVHGDGDSFAPVVKFAMDNKITQWFLFDPVFVLYFLKNMTRAEHTVNILTLFQITPEMVPLLKEKNINWIKSPFGDTTIGMAFFVKTVDQTADEATYDVTNYGPLLDDFFQIELRDGLLYVACRELGEDWKTSGDNFEIINGNYHFRGRAARYRLGDEWVALADLEKIVADLFGSSKANIVVDADYQKIYLAVWEDNPAAEASLDNYFKENYESVNVSYVLRNENYDHFYNSRKIDGTKIRQVCREKLKENT